MNSRDIEKYFKDNQPISVTGAVRHSLMWLTASTSDIIQPNPRFRPVSTHDNGIVIYCIHGTADRNTAFSLVADRILPHLPDTIASIHLISFENRMQGKGIDEFAIQLKDKIKLNQHRRVILMGHSRGGLVAAYFAEYLASANNIEVKCVFNIGTPFAGSSLAMAPLTWLSSSVAQMQPNSDFLTDLNSKISASSIPYHYFAAEFDGLVNNAACCIKEHYHQLVTLDRHGHLSVMSSHRLVDAILSTLLRLVGLPPTEPDCKSSDIAWQPLNLGSP